MNALGASREECLMVGDSAADMEAGKRAGIKTCAVRYGYGREEDLARFPPTTGSTICASSAVESQLLIERADGQLRFDVSHA